MASDWIDYGDAARRHGRFTDTVKIGHGVQPEIPHTDSSPSSANTTLFGKAPGPAMPQNNTVSASRPSSTSSEILPPLKNHNDPHPKSDNVPPESKHIKIQSTTNMKATTTTEAGKTVEKALDANSKQTPNVKENGILSGVNGAFNQVVENFKKMLGFGPECLNGGTRNSAGECICPPFYFGTQCEQMNCTNGGTPVFFKKKTKRESHWECKCPNPDFIYGKHCELIKCMNGGKPIANSGKCACNDYWYEGDFCQNYTSSWITLVGIPVIAIVIILLCCVICRLDFCPRRSTREANRRRRNQAQSTVSGRTRDRRAQQQQQHLLNASRAPRPTAPYRLETIPVFNPRLLDEEPPKITDAPPSYEQALAMSRPSGSQPTQQPVQQPPDYTPPVSGIVGGYSTPYHIPIPPPPSCRPPAVPHSS